jgi:hypothetical protein
MSAEAFSQAIECVERLPGPGTLARAMVILARAGVGLPRIRSWAVATAQSYGIWPYVSRDFPRLLGIAVNEAVEEGRRQLQHHQGA